MKSFENLKRTNADSGKNGGGNFAIDLNTETRIRIEPLLQSLYVGGGW